MHWIKRSFKSFIAKSHFARSARRRPGFETLEDRRTPAGFGSLSGSVYFDSNHNGVKDSNEQALGGFTVALHGTTQAGVAVSASTVTTSGGTFKFTDLEQGTYIVDASLQYFTPPTGGLGNLGGTVAGSSVNNLTLGQGQSITGVTFGATSVNPNTISQVMSIRSLFNRPTYTLGSAFSPGLGQFVVDSAAVAAAGTASLAGTVYNDVNPDGQRAKLTTSEPGLAGVHVTLNGRTTAGATYTQATTTDANGAYSFANLPAGAYFINVEPKVYVNGQPTTTYRATGATVGKFGAVVTGDATRPDQILVSGVTTTAGTGYDFGLAALPSGTLQAALANNDLRDDTANSIVVQDPSVTGVVANVSNLASLKATFDPVNSTPVSILDTVKSDGSFYLDASRMAAIHGSALPTGADYTLTIQATDNSNQTTSTTVTFHLNAADVPTTVTTSGLRYADTTVGTGVAAKAGDALKVHYVGKLTNGTVFDSNVAPATPFSFTLGSNQVIKGWEEGIVGMKVGGVRRLTIPPELAYGASGQGSIPANAELIFDVTMVSIN